MRRWLVRAVIFVVALAAAAAAFVVIQNLPPDAGTQARVQQISDQVAQTITSLMVSDASTALARQGLAGASIGDVVTNCTGTADTLYAAGETWSCHATFVAELPALGVHSEGFHVDISATSNVAGQLTFHAHNAAATGPASFNLPVAQQQYLAAVAPYNAALPSLDAKAAAVRANGGCLCGSDLISVRTAVQQEVTALTALESHVPANVSADVSALIDAKRDMLADLSAMVTATSEPSIATQEDDLLTHRDDDSLAAKVRMDLGLPPPPGATPCNCGL